MSEFTNPATGAKETARVYIRAVSALVGERDPVEILRETPDRFAQVVDVESDPVLTRRGPDGGWSIAAVLQHMADSELMWGVRLRRVLCEDRPSLSGYDQDQWAERLGYDEADAAAALVRFRALRAEHLRLLDRLSDADRRRVGVHTERGDETLDHMIRLYAGHDVVHLNQVDRLRSSTMS